MQETVYRLSESSHARAISAAKFNSSSTQFVVGTVGLREPNKVAVLEFEEDKIALELVSSWDYQDEVWELACSPSAPQVAVANTSNLVEVFSIQEDLERLTALEHSGLVNSLDWTERSFCTSTKTELHNWDLEKQTSDKVIDTNITRSLADPHHESLLAYSNSSAIKVHDFRHKSSAFEIKQAHCDEILSLDFNPNNPYHMVSSSKDCTARIWDMRKEKPLKTIQEHTHWVWQAKFNHYHDQLMLTAGSDNCVTLQRTITGSSAPIDESFFERETDATLSRIENFDDSVYGVCWSAAEAWYFGCISYDSKVTVGVVPTEEKYKILL